MYLCRRKINADYSVQEITQPISTDALMVYVPKAQTILAMIYLTKLSSLHTASSNSAPMFITLLVKYQTPGKFGQYVAHNNSFLNDHRNIAIVRVVPEAMDTDNLAGENLWKSISSLPDIYRCDPCRRTPDLGKWNISCAKASHQIICNWMDENLVHFWSNLPDSADFPKIGTFPTPERLSKGRRVSSGGSSVASGLTNASPVEDYFRQLESSPPPKISPPTLIVMLGKITFRSATFRTDSTLPNSLNYLTPTVNHPRVIPLRSIRHQIPGQSRTGRHQSVQPLKVWSQTLCNPVSGHLKNAVR
jgi:hypothetical protein